MQEYYRLNCRDTNNADLGTLSSLVSLRFEEIQIACMD